VRTTGPTVTIKSLPVRCLFRFSPPDRGIASLSPLCDYKGPLPPSPTTLTAFYPLLYLSPLSALPLTGRAPQPPEFSPLDVVGLTNGPRSRPPLPADSLLLFVPSSSRISLDDGRTPTWASTRGLANLVGRCLILRPAPFSLLFPSTSLNGLLSGLPRFPPLQASKMPHYHGHSPRL
jgi:hypothetical protein